MASGYAATPIGLQVEGEPGLYLFNCPHPFSAILQAVLVHLSAYPG